jgi:hypothetical protein
MGVVVARGLRPRAARGAHAHEFRSSDVQGQGQVVPVQLPAGTDRAAFRRCRCCGAEEGRGQRQPEQRALGRVMVKRRMAARMVPPDVGSL